MSEYWKSTPNYWCKFCKTFVRDTPLARQQHEQTGRHQGNVKHNLKNIHKENEREEREKERAKAEVARLNGIVSGKSSDATESSKKKPARQPAPAPTPKAPTRLTEEERRRQMEQLASMGVVVPDEYRNNMAMAGQWETISVTPITSGQDSQSNAQGRSIGVHKRKLNIEEEEEEEDLRPVRKGWGQAVRSFPTSESQNDNIDVLALLNSGRLKSTVDIKNETVDIVKDEANLQLKEENGDVKATEAKQEVDVSGPGGLLEDLKKEDDGGAAPPIIFKKRKAKVSRPT